MVVRYIEQREAISATLHDVKLRKGSMKNVSEDDLNELEILCTVLKPLKNVTTMMREEKSPTVSLIMPMISKLTRDTQSIVVENETVKRCQKAVQTDLTKRYSNDKTREFLHCATFLDPRFKSLSCCSPDEKQCIQDQVITKVTEIIRNKTAAQSQTHQQSAPPTCEEPPKKEQKMDAMTSFFGSFFEEAVFEEEDDVTDPAIKSAQEEVAQYKMFKNISLNDSPLQWWSVHAKQFPYMSELAKKVLSTPGTSVPSERVFSTAGDLVSASRSALKWHAVDKVLFFKKNM